MKECDFYYLDVVQGNIETWISHDGNPNDENNIEMHLDKSQREPK